MKPSEYLDRNCFFGASTPGIDDVERRHQIGIGNIMWGNDLPHPEGTFPYTRYWIRERFRDVPDDAAVHNALLAQFTGHISIAAAMRPHAGLGQRDAHRTLSTAINAIGISFHREVQADRWMLYHHRSTVAADGMTHAECRVHDEDGALIASFTVDAMVRGFADPSKSNDDRTAL